MPFLLHSRPVRTLGLLLVMLFSCLPVCADGPVLILTQEDAVLQEGARIEGLVLADSTEVGVENGLTRQSLRVAANQVIELGRVPGPCAVTVSLDDGNEWSATTLLLLPHEEGYVLKVCAQRPLEPDTEGCLARFLAGLTAERFATGVARMWKDWAAQNALAGSTTALVCFTPGLQSACVVRGAGHAADFLSVALQHTADVLFEDGELSSEQVRSIRTWLGIANLGVQATLNPDLAHLLVTAVSETLQVVVENADTRLGIKLARDEFDRIQALIQIVKKP